MLRSEQRATNDLEWSRIGASVFGEFIGTTSFLWLAYAGESFVLNVWSAYQKSASASTDADIFLPMLFLYIALVFAFSYAVNLWIFYHVSGGFFNPAITLSLMVCQSLSFVRGLLLMVVQFAGSIVAGFLASGMYPQQIMATPLIATNTSKAFFIEGFLTTLLVLSVFFMAVEINRASFLTPLGLGLALFVVQLVGLYYTGASANPARALGAAVASPDRFQSNFWIYFVGPLFGALLGCAVYELVKVTGYREMRDEVELGRDPTVVPPVPVTHKETKPEQQAVVVNMV